MGLILDSSILIAAERRGLSVPDILERILTTHGDTQNALSAVTVVELTHGIYRAKTDNDRQRRQAFVEELYRAIPVHPVTLEIALLAGKIEGQEAAHGVSIAVPDLLIGATAIYLGYAVVTHNIRHFKSIPGLVVAQM